jgi:dynein light intermediate chain
LGSPPAQQLRPLLLFSPSQISALQEELKDKERQIQELKAKSEFIEKRETERRAHEEKKHAEEVAFLKRTNQQLKAQLESILKKN